MWNECKKCSVLYGGDVPGFDWYHTWNCGMHAYMLVRHFFVKGVDKFQQNRCKSAYGECECEMSAKSAVFCKVGMCLGSIGTTLGIVGCMHICWSGTFLWRGLRRNFSHIGVKVLMVSGNVKLVLKVQCFVWWGCAWVRLVPHLKLWDACIYAGPALFCEGGLEISAKSL